MATPTAPERSALKFLSFTTWSLVAMAAGLAFGVAAHGSAAPLGPMPTLATAVGDLWISALQMVALPLALFLTLAATAGATGDSAKALGARAIIVFVVALATAAFFAIVVMRIALPAVDVPAGAVASLSTIPLPANPAAIAPSTNQSWWLAIIPRNIFAAAARGDIFPLLLSAIVFGVAVAKLPEEQRASMTRVFSATSQAPAAGRQTVVLDLGLHVPL